jgi:hypothetical protein
MENGTAHWRMKIITISAQHLIFAQDLLDLLSTGIIHGDVPCQFPVINEKRVRYSVDLEAKFVIIIPGAVLRSNY